MRLCAILTCVGLFAGPALAAPQLDIRSIVVGTEILQVDADRQLTFREDGDVVSASISPNGKQVAFLTTGSGKTRLCLVKSSGGKVTTVMTSPPDQPTASATHPGETEGFWMLGDHRGIAWSPDSSRFVVSAEWHPGSLEGGSGRHGILVLAANGAYQTSLMMQEKQHITATPIFAPNGRRIAAVTWRYQPDGDRPDVWTEVMVFDLSQGSVSTAYSQEEGEIDLVGWTDAGNGILAVTTQPVPGQQRSPRQLREIRTDGSSGGVIDGDCPAGTMSPDARYRAIQERSKLAAQDVQTGTSIPIASRESCSFVGWVPPTGTLVYSQEETVSDGDKQRTGKVRALWLARLSESKADTMCLALDSDRRKPSWSADGMKMAYTCRERLHVVELAKRPPTVDEKLAAGLLLTEEEERLVLQINAKQISNALRMYASDHDDALPGALTITDDLRGRLPDNAFLRPGTNQMVFNYTPAGFSAFHDIEATADTIIGELDPGCYSWKIVIYADGHVKTVPK